MKRLILTAAALLLPVPAVAQGAAAQPVKPFASAAELQALLAQAKAEHKPGELTNAKLGVSAPGLPMMLEYRKGDVGSGPSIHPTMAELIEVVEGSCTLVLGGSVIGATPAKIGGTAIEGDTRRALKKGDLVFVPANVPHWFVDVRELAMLTLHIPVVAQ